MFSQGNLLLEVLMLHHQCSPGCWDQFAASVEIPAWNFVAWVLTMYLGGLYTLKRKTFENKLTKQNQYWSIIDMCWWGNMERNTRVSLSIVVIWMANVGLKQLVSENENWPFLGTKIPQQTWPQRKCVCVCALFLATAVHSKIIKQPCFKFFVS